MKLIFYSVILASVSSSIGLKCYQCTQEIDNEFCNWKGGAMECDINGEASCMNAVSRNENGSYEVSKTCTKKSICENVQKLQPCTGKKLKFCYSCCDGDRCNNVLTQNETTELSPFAQVSSIYLPESDQSCEELPGIENGNKTCIGSRLGDMCLFSCMDGHLFTLHSSKYRVCSFSINKGYYWSGENAVCEKEHEECTGINANAASARLVQISPEGVVYRVMFQTPATKTHGWTVFVAFPSALTAMEYIQTYDAVLADISQNQTMLTFTNPAYNADLSQSRNQDFVFVIKSKSGAIQTSDKYFKGQVSFIGAKPCPYMLPIITAVQPNTTETTMQPSTIDTGLTTLAIPTTTTVQTEEIVIEKPKDGAKIPNPDLCTVGTFVLSKNAYTGKQGDRWFFAFRIVLPKSHYFRWVLKVKFNKNVEKIIAFNFVGQPSNSSAKLWTFTAHGRNREIKGKGFVGVGIATVAQKLEEDNGEQPKGVALICNNVTLPKQDGPKRKVVQGQLVPVLEETTIKDTKRCKVSSPSGILPERSYFIDATSFKKSEDGEKYDYNELLHKSLIFYEAQRSGYLPKTNRIPWRGDSGLKDGCDRKIDLVGGYYDAGDHVKFGFPMAATIAVISWGVIEFKEAYSDVEEYRNVLEMIKWGTDYFIKAHTKPNELWAQVGDGNKDHSYWGHPETMNMNRPAFKIDEKHPGTEVAAETAAALASASIVFKDIDENYSESLLNHSIQLFDFADKFRREYHKSIPGVTSFYRSWSGYNDELAWAAMWLFKATRDMWYFNYAAKLADKVSMHEFSWDNKGPGVIALLAQTNKRYLPKLERGVKDFSKIKRTPGGLSWLLEWGPNRYSANYAFISLITVKMLKNSPKHKFYHNYAEQQIHTMLGDGDNDRSYVVGFGKNPPQRPHHRSASCIPWAFRKNAPCSYDDLQKKTPNDFILYGALVGGPANTGKYVDDRKDYKLNEVAMDYNSGYQSALAGLKYFVIQNRNS